MSEVKVHRNLSSINLQMIVAMDQGGGIGIDGKLPWPHHAEDFKRFKEITMGAVVIMGRKTFEEIEAIRLIKAPNSKELLPGRRCVVISSREISSPYEISVEKTLLNAVKSYYEETKSIFVIGGLQLYREAFPYISTLYVTMFEEYFKCDRYLPLPYMTKHFKIVEGAQGDGCKFLKCQRVAL